MQLPYQCRHCQYSVTTVSQHCSVDCGGLETTGNRVFDMHVGWMGFMLLWELSNSRIAEACLERKSPSLWTSGHAWGVNHLDMSRTPYWASEENTRNNPPCHITPRSRHYLYVIHLIDGLHCFYRTTIALKTISAGKWRKGTPYYYYYLIFFCDINIFFLAN